MYSVGRERRDPEASLLLLSAVFYGDHAANNVFGRARRYLEATPLNFRRSSMAITSPTMYSVWHERRYLEASLLRTFDGEFWRSRSQ